MRLGLSLACVQVMECPVCRQHISMRAQQDTTVLATLFGAMAYAVCPSCGQEVKDHRDTRYRARVRKFHRKRAAVRAAIKEAKDVPEV